MEGSKSSELRLYVEQRTERPPKGEDRVGRSTRFLFSQRRGEERVAL